MPTITLCMLLVHIHQARRLFFSITPHISLIQESDLTYSNVSRERFGGDIPRILFCWDIWGFHDVFLNLLMKLIRITWKHSIYQPSWWVLFAKCKHLTLTLLVLMCLFNWALCFASFLSKIMLKFKEETRNQIIIITCPYQITKTYVFVEATKTYVFVEATKTYVFVEARSSMLILDTFWNDLITHSSDEKTQG